jgi:hypothetical protein
VLLLALCLVTPHVPGIVGAAAVTAVVTGVNLLEYWLVVSGRPLPLIRRRMPA